nr:MAG TPA: hypothetical protein [Caudoviricetes sp.]
MLGDYGPALKVDANQQSHPGSNTVAGFGCNGNIYN